MVLGTPLWMQAQTGDPVIQYSGQQDRALVQAIAPYPGVMLAGDLKVSQRGAGANMSVDVTAGSVFIPGTSVVNQGTYFCQSTAVVNVPIAAAPGSGSRTDLVIAQLHDKQADGGTQYSWSPDRVTGSVGGGTPATPASAVALATVAVTSSTVSIANAAITDVRSFASGFSSVFVAPTFASLPSPARQGDQGFEQDTKIHTIYDGTGWNRYSAAYTGVNFVTTDASGYATVALPSNLGYTPAVVNCGIMTNTTGGGPVVPFFAIVDQTDITSAHFKVRIWGSAASGTVGPFVSNTVSVAFTVRK